MIQKLTNKLNDRKNNKGFTLVELIVVIVILAILAAILIPGLLKWIDEARDKQYQLEARSIYLAAQAELAKGYTGAAYTTDEQSVTDLAEIKKLSGLSDITEVKYTTTADGTITEFKTTFKSSNGTAGIKMKWTAAGQKWENTY